MVREMSGKMQKVWGKSPGICVVGKIFCNNLFNVLVTLHFGIIVKMCVCCKCDCEHFANIQWL